MRMLREEAIRHIEAAKLMLLGNDNQPISDLYYALEMAIKALEQEPCEDAISRQAVIDITWEEPSYTDALNVLTEVRDKVKALPTVNPQEPKTGHWIDDEFGSKCSCCGIHTHLDKFDRPMKFKYCSMCRAKMIEPQESEDKE